MSSALIRLCIRLACAELANQMLIKLTTRKKRKWVRKWIERREQYGASNTLLKELAAEEPGDYRNILRITEAKFVELLEMISPTIRKQDTRMRTAINCKTKLEITLNYIGSGSSLKQLSYLFRVPHNTISTFLPEVLKAIYEALTGFIQVPDTEDEWKSIQRMFELKWNFPNCCGALDGKHINILRPANSTSTFFNYKQFYSIILFAMVDADYCFRYIDVGSDGRASDSTIFRTSTLNIAMEENLLNWPVGGLCVGDDAFPLRTNLLKPFRHRNLSLEEKIFNYRLSRARRISENAFGILASRFRILRRPIDLKVETTEILIKAACAIHNWLRMTSSRHYFPATCIDREDTETNQIHPGTWRMEIEPLTGVNRNDVGYLSNHNTNDAESLRRRYARAFCTTSSVPWQLRAVQNT